MASNPAAEIRQSAPLKRDSVRGTVDAENKTSAQKILENNEDKSQWEWVTVPDEDLFGEAHTGCSINFERYSSGRHFVCPEAAEEIRRLIKNRLRGDMRVLQPKQDAEMARIMSKSQLGAATNPGLKGLNDN